MQKPACASAAVSPTVTDGAFVCAETPSTYPKTKEQAGARKRLLLGGMNFGAKILSDGVAVVSLGDETDKNIKLSPAYRAGIRKKDVILSINGTPVLTASDVLRAVQTSEGKPLTLRCRRQGAEKEFSVTPERDTDGNYRIGVFLRDSAAGIGTVTYIDKESLTFGGLGHGICDPDTGAPVPIRRGEVRRAVITGIAKGNAGKPGEMRGYLDKTKIGALIQNDACGVFGIFTECPVSREVEIAYRDEVKEGNATLYTTLDGDCVTPYTVKISTIDREATGNKCFTVEITDASLLAKTGGIIQGMSGSPIIQNGKLVGAVTHVLINDPTTGYGIFIENMLNASESARNELPAA